MEDLLDDLYSQDQEHDELENNRRGEGAPYETRQQQPLQPRSSVPPDSTSPQPPQDQYSNPEYQGQPPQNYPPHANPQQIHHQAGYVPAHPVQAPPQNYQTQPSPNTPRAASPHNPAPKADKNGTAAPMYHNTDYGGQRNQAPAPAKNTGPVGWTTGLFDCMEDPNNALITACCPCVTFGQIAEIVDSGQTTCGTSGALYAVIASFTAAPCLMSCTYRTKMRNQYDLLEDPAADCLTHCFCECCALCQEYRELRNRGLDPASGWQGNMMGNQKMQQPEAAMTPPVNQTMPSPNEIDEMIMH